MHHQQRTRKICEQLLNIYTWKRKISIKYLRFAGLTAANSFWYFKDFARWCWCLIGNYKTENTPKCMQRFRKRLVMKAIHTSNHLKAHWNEYFMLLASCFRTRIEYYRNNTRRNVCKHTRNSALASLVCVHVKRKNSNRTDRLAKRNTVGSLAHSIESFNVTVPHARNACRCISVRHSIHASVADEFFEECERWCRLILNYSLRYGLEWILFNSICFNCIHWPLDSKRFGVLLRRISYSSKLLT